jgi:hypothetical protein
MFLSRRNQAGLLGFVDINSDLYDERAVGVSCSQALAEMYGQFDNGLVIKGPAVFGEAYRRAGVLNRHYAANSQPVTLVKKRLSPLASL